jgi:protoporphyrinogen oxidase
MKVIFVGADMAGLAAMHILNSAGAQVVCFEKGGVPAGRVITARSEGFILGLGEQFFFRSCDTCFQLATKCGLYDELTTWECRSSLRPG